MIRLIASVARTAVPLTETVAAERRQNQPTGEPGRDDSALILERVAAGERGATTRVHVRLSWRGAVLGASIGTRSAGPWGALVGGVLGAIIGPKS